MLKVASYCRVSTDKEDRVYANEGITGTSTKKRAAFNHMIADAHMERFQLILTKEVSRFSRNILNTIAYTRGLKALGVYE